MVEAGKQRKFSLQVGWKKLGLVDEGVDSLRLVTMEEYGRKFRRRVTLKGYEVVWVRKKLQEASDKSGGALFLGKLCSKARAIEVSREQNVWGRFIEIKVREQTENNIIRIPEEGQEKGWFGLQKALAKIDLKHCDNGDRVSTDKLTMGCSSKQCNIMEVPWLKFRDVMDSFQQSLAQCFGDSMGETTASVKVDLGLWKFAIPISTISGARKTFRTNHDHQVSMKCKVAMSEAAHAEEMEVRKLHIQRAREDVNGSSRGIGIFSQDCLNFKWEKKYWDTTHLSTWKVKEKKLPAVNHLNVLKRGLSTWKVKDKKLPTVDHLDVLKRDALERDVVGRLNIGLGPIPAHFGDSSPSLGAAKCEASSPFGSKVEKQEFVRRNFHRDNGANVRKIEVNDKNVMADVDLKGEETVFEKELVGHSFLNIGEASSDKVVVRHDIGREVVGGKRQIKGVLLEELKDDFPKKHAKRCRRTINTLKVKERNFFADRLKFFRVNRRCCGVRMRNLLFGL